MMAADVELPGEDTADGVPISTPRVSAPRVFFELPTIAFGNAPVATKDGDGFLVVISGEAGGEFDRIQVTLNFLEELKQLAAGGR
jgi:hypothetical protein